MTQAQEDHVCRLGSEFVKLMSKKYRAGQQEHGGNLWEVSPNRLLDNAIEEAIDQVVYLLTLKEQLYGNSTLSD